MYKNYYKILEVDSSASPEVIEKAYKALAKKYHPDLQEESQKKSAGEKLKEINEAYEILSNPDSRANFDKTLAASNISSDDFNKIADENRKLQNELNNLKHTNNQTSFTNNNYFNNSVSSNFTNSDALAREQQIELEKQRQEEYQRQLEYEAQMQAAREKAYHDAYIQDLKNRGYKIKYKKTPKEIFKNFIALLITALIIFLILQIPFVKQFFINLYEGNTLIQSICNIFIKNH